VTDLQKETRFKGMPLLHEHGVVSGMTVVIRGRNRPFGILGAHTTQHRSFTPDDANFLQAVANVLAAAIDRRQIEEDLQLSHDQLAAILQGTAEGITAQDVAGHLVYANDAAARLLDYPSTDVLLQTPLAEVMQKYEILDEAGNSFPLDRLPDRLALQGEPAPAAIICFRKLDTGEIRWLNVKARPVIDEQDQVKLVVNIFQDITSLKRTELSQRILAEAGELLAASFDYTTRLNNVTRLVVPLMADWCTVYLIETDESLHQVAVAHADPDKVAMALDLQGRYPPDWDAPSGVPHVLRTGQSEFSPEITEAMLAAAAQDEEHLRLIQSMRMKSAMIVPLTARGRTLGAMTFVWAESGRRYDPTDLELAEELAHRVALAVDNARLYDEAQRLNAELEERVKARTAELEVANIQLQDEIAERKRAEAHIRESEQQLAEAQQIAHLGSWEWDIVADKLTWSDEMCRIYGVNPQEFETSYESFLDHVHPGDRNMVREIMEKAYHTHQPFSFEHRIIRSDNQVRTLQGRGKVEVNQTGQPVKMVGTGQDITELKQAEQALRESEARIRTIFEGAGVGMSMIDQSKRIIESNPVLQELLDYSREELHHMAFIEFIHPAYAKLNETLYDELISSTQRRYQIEIRYLNKHRQVGWGRLTVSPVWSDDTVNRPQFAIVMLEDITEQKEVEAEVAELRRRLMEGREMERLYLAQELHDGPLQDLNSTFLRLSELEPVVVNDEAGLSQMAAVQATLQKIMQTLRVICGELRPPALAPFGLEKAIRSHVEDFQKQSPEVNLNLELIADGQTLPEQTRLALFRIYQQAVTNIGQHAQARHVSIRFKLDPDLVILEIEDDGQGFVMPRRHIELVRHGHYGLAGAMERAEAIGGSLQVVSSLGHGTLLRVMVPRINEQNFEPVAEERIEQ
jgi:PAS domain S-box-containing protein